MVSDTTEQYYFFIAMTTALIWSLIAGALLENDERYVGMAATAFTIVITVLYCLH